MSTIRVLSIESNEENRLALRKCFEGRTGLVLAAEVDTGARALQTLESEQIDVVLFDLGLAGLNSIELIKKIRKQCPGVRVVIVTASDLPEDIFASLDAGADGYLLKGNLFASLGMAVSSARLGAVWLDPGIAQQVLHVIETARITRDTRTLPTGLMTMPLLPEEKSLLTEVATGNCANGVCMVDPSFINKLKRFAGAPK